MFKFLAVFVILAVAVHAYPAPEEVAVQAPKALSSDGQAELAGTNPQVDLEGSEANDGGDLKGSETFGFGYYPVAIGYGRGFGYGRYGGYGYGGYGGGWGYGGGYGGWGGYRRRGWGGYW